MLSVSGRSANASRQDYVWKTKSFESYYCVPLQDMPFRSQGVRILRRNHNRNESGTAGAYTRYLQGDPR